MTAKKLHSWKKDPQKYRMKYLRSLITMVTLVSADKTLISFIQIKRKISIKCSEKTRIMSLR